MVYQIGGHEMPEFKVGDWVYCPVTGVGVYAVVVVDGSRYPVIASSRSFTAADYVAD